MKIKHFLALGVAVLVTSCTDQFDDGLDTNINKQGLEIDINGAIEQEYVSRVDDGGFCDGDRIGLYGVNYTADNTVAGVLLDNGNQVDNIRYTFDEEMHKWTASSAAYYKDVNTHIDLYAYYPYGTPNSTSAYEFAVQKDQNNNDGYALSDFLWAKATNVVPSENKVQLHFSHRMSGIRIILKEGTGFAKDEFQTLKQSAVILNTKQESVIDLATGIVTAQGAIPNEGILTMNTEEGLRAIVIPQTVKANTALFSVTLDGMTYQYQHTAAMVYQPGKQVEFTMKVNRKQPSGKYEFVLTKTEIVDWIADTESHGGEARQYYVVHQEKPGTLGELIRANKKNPDKIKNLKISGKINIRDFAFMRDSMEILQAINLKESRIEGHSNVECYIYDENGSGDYYNIYFDGKITKDDAYVSIQEKYPNSSYIDIFNVINWEDNVIPSNAFYNKNTLIHFSFPEKVTKIESGAFYQTLLSGALIIPDDVTVIGGSAFAYTNITSLTLPNNLKEIHSEAFVYCKSLAGSLNLPESLTELGDRSFANCRGLSGVLQIPHQIKEIQHSCFVGCDNLSGLILPEGLESIGSSAFLGCTKMSGELLLPQSLKEIEKNSFGGCMFQGELIIPEQIKMIKSGVFNSSNFTSIIFPSELIKIESNAFSYNYRLCEPLIFPETLLAIDEYAFQGCNMLPKVVFPSQLATIQSDAFTDCYSLSSIISKAKTPPTILGSAFNGVAKDNFTVEVPEGSVVKYQTADGWSEFKRINAHHDFSISRSLMRALNAEYSHTYTLRVPSGQAWSIQSKPDWVTVSPSNGTGKTDVTITVNKMPATEDMFGKEVRDEWNNIYTEYYNGRVGEIVFLLNDKNYTSTMKVEQYNYNRADGEVITHQKATKGDGVNIVFMGDCFDAFDIYQGKYTQGIEEAIEHFFAVEPYKTYREYFNVYTVMGMSPESGTGTVNTIREAKFGSQYSLSNGIVPNESIVYEYACKTPTVTPENINETLVVLIENTQDYGGLTYMWSDGSAIAVCPMSKDAYPYDFRGLVQHEAGGHGFGKLADEYIYTNGFIQSCICLNPHVIEFNIGKSFGWYDNLSLSGNMNDVPWSHLIYHPTYSNIVDMYEGGYYHTRGVYRSEATSCMNNNIPYFSAISRESIVKRIMDYANVPFSQDDFYDKDVLDAGSRSLQPSWSVSEYNNRIGASKQYAPKLMRGKPMLK